MHASPTHCDFSYLDSGLRGLFWINVKEGFVFLNTVKFVRLLAGNMNEAGRTLDAAHDDASARDII